LPLNLKAETGRQDVLRESAGRFIFGKCHRVWSLRRPQSRPLCRNSGLAVLKQRIVIYRLGSLGDTIVALPCFNLIARAFPDAERIVLTNIPVSSKAAPLETILGSSGLIHGAIAYPQKLRDPAELLRLRSRLRQLEASALVYLTASRGLLRNVRDVAFFSLCGFGNIIGAPLTNDLAHNRIDNKTGEEEPEYLRLARNVAALGPIDFEDAGFWDLHLTEAEKAAGDHALATLAGSPFMAINMGGKAVEKDWGAGNWRACLQMMKDGAGNFGLAIVGGAEDNVRAAEMAVEWGGAVVNLCGRLSPRECAAALRSATLFIGHDSGPLHLAACMQVPCIGLFGGYNRPRKWHPYGNQHHVFHEMAGMEQIRPDAVAAMALKKLETGPAPMRR
jgi:ADP-heptose:LPS heptosyltransferase